MSAQVYARILLVLKYIIVVPLIKLVVLLKNGVYAWLAISFYVFYIHRDVLESFVEHPTLVGLGDVIAAYGQTLVSLDKQVYDYTNEIIALESSLTGGVMFFYYLALIAGAILTFLLYVKFLDFLLRETVMNGSTRLVTWSFSILIYVLVVGYFAEEPFKGMSLFLSNSFEIFEVILNSGEFSNNSTLMNQSITHKE